jgi:hypothetical protein
VTPTIVAFVALAVVFSASFFFALAESSLFSLINCHVLNLIGAPAFDNAKVALKNLRTVILIDIKNSLRFY